MFEDDVDVETDNCREWRWCEQTHVMSVWRAPYESCGQREPSGVGLGHPGNAP